MNMYLDIANIHNGWNETQHLIMGIRQKYIKEHNEEPTIKILSSLTELSEECIYNLFPTITIGE